ncbi:hypothetical protein BD410DRAFT_846840 [Rickenella mellea]|uniref:Uncharacterized protein n=1 Tax=Rickenella mellea TaxID=50990 RepID=A0A4Y7PDX2_9AGAM|nr:hypothetical protein BD410DRAFT_846840 [Rickenella mellea]
MQLSLVLLSLAVSAFALSIPAPAGGPVARDVGAMAVAVAARDECPTCVNGNSID